MKKTGNLVFDDGSKYVGEMENGFPNGIGTYYFANGNKYEGEMKRGLFSGVGRLTFPNGEKYEGYFLNGQKHGHGKYVWPDGSAFEGEYRNNRPWNGIEIDKNPNGTFTKIRYENGFGTQENTINTESGGCYIATCVYGSYDCPQVLTLRRYRDNTLAKTWYGRAFIKTYYAISPTIVKWFGETKWFKNVWRKKLDRIIEKLESTEK